MCGSAAVWERKVRIKQEKILITIEKISTKLRKLNLKFIAYIYNTYTNT